MERKGNNLYFGSEEAKKFIRSIKLFSIFNKNLDAEGGKKLAEHETAHIKMFHQLVCNGKIVNYCLQAKRKELIASVCFDYEGLTQKERLEVLLAPLNPSVQDLICAVGFKKGYLIAKNLEKMEGNYYKNLKKLCFEEVRR